MNDPTGHIGCFGKNADDGPQCNEDGRINNKGHNQPMGNKAMYRRTPTVTSTPIVPITPTVRIKPTIHSSNPRNTPIATGTPDPAAMYWALTSTPKMPTPYNPYANGLPTQNPNTSLNQKVSDIVNAIVDEYDKTNPVDPFVGTNLDPLSPLDNTPPAYKKVVDAARIALTVFATGRSILNGVGPKIDPFLEQPIPDYNMLYPYSP